MATPLETKPPTNPAVADLEEPLFSDFPRVQYERNPLEFVVCELKFPPILKLEVEVPALFQDKVRNAYPLYSEITPISLSNQPPGELARLLGSLAPFPLVKSYEFSTIDKFWTLSLRRDALSLTCRQYTRWEEFQKHFTVAFNALLESYPIQFFVRIGLRYRDQISREKLGLQGVAWGELLDPWIAGEFQQKVKVAVAASSHTILFRLKTQEAQIQLQHGLQQSAEGTDASYVLDLDLFTLARKEHKDVSDVLNFFNKYSWRFFRSCIRDRLHQAMGPKPI